MTNTNQLTIVIMWTSQSVYLEIIRQHFNDAYTMYMMSNVADTTGDHNKAK